MERITLYDVENDRTLDVMLSPEDARRASLALLRASVEDKRESKEQANQQEVDNQLEDNKDDEHQENDDPGVLYRWSPIVVMLLLRTYQEMEQKFTDGNNSHKKCWELVAKKLNAEGYSVTGPQCSSKLRSLKKTYKAIKDHNSKSGNNRRTWQYFEVMNEIFAKAAWCEPVAVASSSGVVIKPADTESGTESASSSSGGSGKSNALTLLKRRLQQKEEHENNKKTRHEERMAMDQKLLEILQKFVEK